MANKWSGAVFYLAFLTVMVYVSCITSEIVGAHVYWKQIANKKVKIMYRLQWEGGSTKQDFSGKGTKRQEGDIYVCDFKTSKQIAVLQFQNLKYNPYREWTVGQGATKVSLKKLEFHFYLAERCMSPFKRLKEPQMSKWAVYISGNVTSSSGNHSPVSYMNPVVPFRPSCHRNIDIPIHDDDHDFECRWPSLTHGECVPSNDMFANVLPSCEPPRGATLTKCKLKFDGTNKGNHQLTVMIEARKEGQFQSKVPVQFRVEIIPTKKSHCSSEPSFNVHEDHCKYNRQSGQPITENVTMKAVRGQSLIEVESIMPTGMTLRQRNTVDGYGKHVYELEFRWPGRYVIPGTHPVCFVSTTSDGFMSRQQCIDFKIYSGDVTVHIVSPTKENNFKMKVDFNHEIKLPSATGKMMLVIGETNKKQLQSTLQNMAQLIFQEKYDKLYKMFKVYDFGKESTPVMVDSEDKNSVTLDLHKFFAKRVISKKSRFIVMRDFKDPISMMKYPPCTTISGLNEGVIDVCIFDGKSAACVRPY
ncbi:uncharacterized protein [Antedon mediterranea]|uniref:uncharacterized protein n=1 Tax=Antedon mediterranea TaxID=105859 RepID=UPI003AF67109